MNKGLVNAVRTAKEQGFYNGTVYGLNLMSMITIIALHNALELEDEQYRELEVEMQRIMNEHNLKEAEGMRDAKEYMQGIANQVRMMHGLPFIRDWFEE